MSLRERAHRRMLGATSALARWLGFEILRRGPSGVVPDLPPSGDQTWTRRSEMPGVDLDLDIQIDFIEAHLKPFVDEFTRDVRGAGFELWNGLYQAGDAEILYALVRHLCPTRVLEVGSGHSTLVSAAACEANAREGHFTELIAVDPQPRASLNEIRGVAGVEQVDCREIGLDRFLELGSGDILFVDTWHVVKLGSEVNWLVLEVLPRLAPGVWVHFHDIHLPYEYPRYILQLAGYLNEQYLLRAFLTGNHDWEVTLALAALARDRNDRLTKLVPSLREAVPGQPEVRTWLPASFWIRRRG